MIRPIAPEDFQPASHADVVRGPTRPSLSYWEDAWIRLKRNKQALASLAIICALLLFTLAGPLFWRLDPGQPVLSRISEPPRWDNSVTVVADPPPFPEVVVGGADPAPEADGAALPAPATLEVVGKPTVLAVRLRWSHVPGAAGYLDRKSVV